MAKNVFWTIEEVNNSISLFKRNKAEFKITSSKIIHECNHLNFSLCFNNYNKLNGYIIQFNIPPEVLKRVDNSYIIIYSSMYDSPKMDVIYEDNYLRFLTFDHKNSQRDYLLIGRWRQETSQ